MDRFHEDILSVVRSIPPCTVVSYGQLAAYVGAPRASREAGWAMHALGKSPDFPWWRVLGGTGQITMPEKADATPEQQQKLLEKEGVVFTAPLMLDIERYRYRPSREALSRFPVLPESLDELLQKYAIAQPPLL